MTWTAATLAGCGLLLAACGGAGSTLTGPTTPASDLATDAPRCYELVGGSSRTVIKVEAAPSANDAAGGQVTVYSYVDGAEEFTPETTSGRLEGDAFVYGDGTRLLLTEQTLTWPQDSLLEGAVFTSAPCP